MGIGDDTAYGGAGNDVIFGGKSNAGHNSIYGGDGADFLFGGDAPDLIDGGKGDDWIWGNSSGSSVNGIDQLIGGDGNDHIFGGIGIDKIFGGNGDDFIYGGTDTDPIVFGGDGNDYMNGNSGVDVMNGDGGDDIMDGGPGVDQLFGGSGDDILRPGPGITSIGGNGGGADVLIGGDSATGPGGATTDNGFDFADYSQQIGTIGIVGDLANQALVSQLPKDKTPLPLNVPTATSTGDVWFEMEGVIGSKNADVLRGDSPTDPDATVSHGNNWLIGGSGNDLLEGRGGNDVIVGGTIRLDTLIGTYKDANGVQDTYTSYVEGASHRVAATSTLSGGLLDFVSGHGVSGVTYDDHLTSLLKSGAYKDYFLGDGGYQNGTDTAAYSGNQSDYKVTYVPFTDAHGTQIDAFQIQDLRPNSPDGTDLLVGIQNLSFGYNETTGAGTLVNIVDALDVAPTITSTKLSAAFNENAATPVDPTLKNATPQGTVIGTLSAQDMLTQSQMAYNAQHHLQQGPLTWSIVNATALPAGLFALAADPTTFNGPTVSDTAKLSFATAPDFEALKAAAPASLVNGQLVFTVKVQVSDGVLTATQDETVVINNVDEQATGTIRFGSTSVSGNTVTFTGSKGDLMDPDVSGAPGLTYGLSGTGASGLTFTGGNQFSGIHTFHLTGTYAQPAPLSAAMATSPETAFVGTSGNDTIGGTPGAEIMVGLNGNDTYVVNNTGDIVVEGVNGGNDTVQAYINTYVLPDNVENLFFMGSGDFTGTGNALANTIVGGAGNDTFIATVDNASDIYIGNGGADTMDYSAYATNLKVDFTNGTVGVQGAPSANNDLFGGIQNLVGGSGNDTIVAAVDTVANIFDGGAGTDTIDYSAYATGLKVDFTKVSVGVNGGYVTVEGSGSTGDQIKNIENFTGGKGADTVVAAADGLAHIYDGGTGNLRDTVDFSNLTASLTIDLRTPSSGLVGGTSITIKNFENVIGGSGDDYIYAEAKDNTVNAFDGGAGSNTADYSNYSANLAVDFGNATATVGGSGNNADTLTNIQNFVGGSGADTIVAAVDAVAHKYNGGGGLDTLDLSHFTASTPLTINLSTGKVTGGGTDITMSNIENVTGGAGNDTIVAAADAITHVYNGGAGTDTLDLSQISSALAINLGTGKVTGGANITMTSIEKVVGGAADDTATVGVGSTANFTGGAGADTLVFGSLAALKNGSSRDVFTDFTSKTDHIDLRAVDSNTSQGGTQHTFTLVGAYSGTDPTQEFGQNSAGQIKYHTETINNETHTILDIHTSNGPGAANDQIDLGVGAKTILAADLILH
jgi:Ca2+-binding RTX toxin-like protein